MHPVELSVVIAVYNEEEVLEELYKRLRAALEAIGKSYEVILVDDGSRDRSWGMMRGLQSRDPEHFRVFSFTRNFGHHIALTAGLDQARGEIMIMMDADLQDQPEEIPKLLNKLDEGYDVVWGERAARQFAWYKNLSSKLFLWLMNSVARAEVHLDSSIFRAMRRPVADDLKGLREKARYLPGLVRWLGYRQTSVPVEHGKRFAGQTKYSLYKLLKLALSTATSFSAAPLQFATLSGMAAAGVAALAVIYIVVRKLLGGYTVPGYASIMIAIFAFGALQLIVIGLMGEYVSRIYREAQGRPLYVLKDEKKASIARATNATTSQRLSALSQETKQAVRSAIASDQHLPLANVFPDSSVPQIAEYHLNEWAKSDPFVFTNYQNGRLASTCLLQELEFDTRLLGMPAARILYGNSTGGDIDLTRVSALSNVLSQVSTFAKEKGIRLIDARVSNQDLFIARAYEEAGFHSVDLLVTLGATKEKIAKVLGGLKYDWSGDAIGFSPSLIIRPMIAGEEIALAEISAEAFADHSMIQDRFFLEPTILPERARALFREWFMNLSKKHLSGNGSVLVAEVDGKLAGYLGMEPMAPMNGVTWWKDSLNAVAAEARGQGVYRALVIAALAHIQKMDAAGLITKTQSSTYRVINTWLHLGCDILESSATLHWVG